MLHDPRHDRTPSLAGFALFVASRDENEQYDWPNCFKCAVAQYLASLGLEIPLADWRGTIGIMNRIAHGIEQISCESDREQVWTFGRLAERILDYQMGSATDATLAKRELVFTD